jgi:hypothetical protein
VIDVRDDGEVALSSSRCACAARLSDRLTVRPSRSLSSSSCRFFGQLLQRLSSAGSSPMVTFSIRVLPSRSDLQPGTLSTDAGAWPTSGGRVGRVAMGCRSNSRMTSPDLQPALGCRAVFQDLRHQRPPGSVMPKDSARSRVTSWISTPSQPRVTLPCSLSCWPHPWPHRSEWRRTGP